MRIKPIVFVLLFIIFIIFLINGCNNKEQISEQNNVQTIKEEDIGSVSIKIIDKDTGKPIKGLSSFRYDCMDGPCVGGSWHGIINNKHNIKIEQLKFGTYNFIFEAEGYCRSSSYLIINSEEEKEFNAMLRRTDFKEKIRDKEKVSEIVSGLINSLNKQVISYNNSYQEGFYQSSSTGRSGSGWGSEKSNIYINVYNNEVLDYKKQYFGEISTYPYEKYLEYYDKAKNKTCKKEYTTNSDCIPIEPIRPEFKKPLMGCKLKSDSVVSKHYCMCGEKEIPIHNDESKNYGISCEEDIWQENMRFGFDYIYYYPEKKEGICFYDLIDKNGKYWATLCKNENFTLIPLVDKLDLLENVTCYQTCFQSYEGMTRRCECYFNPIEINLYVNEIPRNLDSEIKKEIISYLNEINITSISEEDNQKYGHCYYFFHKCFEQKFCFNQDSLITYAQWGLDIHRSDSSAYVKIHYFEKIDEEFHPSPDSTNEDPDYCKEGPPQYSIFLNYGLLKIWNDECWINLAEKTQNISYCNNVHYSRDKCYYVIEDFLEDPLICDNVKKEYRSMCLLSKRIR